MTIEQSVPAALLLGLALPSSSGHWPILDSIQELQELARTAGVQIKGTVIQNRSAPHPISYFGQGKIEELKPIIVKREITIVLVDDELSPLQNRTLEKMFNVKVVDRTGLILDIFAKRAKTYEAKLQVELAQLEYIFPRLTRMWTHLSRLGGGIGTRGPGEKQLEVDKRRLNERIGVIKDKLDKIKNSRETKRKKRQLVPVLSGAIVGYTNAGKSTLLHTLTKADVLVEDKVFATLDPVTRTFILPTKEKILLTDTVGFIQKLPHQLVSSFRSTMEEILEANFILHVIDVSHPRFVEMITTSEQLLKELGADSIPQLYVFNKMDKIQDPSFLEWTHSKYTPQVRVSAVQNLSRETLDQAIQKLLQPYYKRFTFRIPFDRMDIVSLLHEYGNVVHVEYSDQITITVEINAIIGEKIIGQWHSLEFKS